MRSGQIVWVIAMCFFSAGCEEELGDFDCGEDTDDVSCEDMEENEIEQTALAVTGNLILNDVYYVTGDTSLYSTATGSTVLRTIANRATVKIVVSAPSNGRYRIEHASSVWGWISGSALTLAYHYNSALSSNVIGVPPAVPGRHSKFDSDGSI